MNQTDYCPNCGSSVPSDYEFCGSCGNRLAGGAKAARKGTEPWLIALVIFIAVVFVACGLLLALGNREAQTNPDSVALPAETPTTIPPSSSPTEIPPVTESQTDTLPPEEHQAAFVEANVVRVIDGDTIEVSIEGSLYRVRYIGIDTPETVHPQKPVEYFGKEASDKNRELVEGKTVRLEKDVSETDHYGRLLRYVWVDDVMINAELVRLGYAQVSSYPPDIKYQDLFLELQTEARNAGRGLWTETQSSTSGTPTVKIPDTTNCPGATAICRDGTCSYAQHRSDTCSYHGGVREWINQPVD